jgi:hypothetical protein
LLLTLTFVRALFLRKEGGTRVPPDHKKLGFCGLYGGRGP